jgi:superfamily II RNA helicase
MQHDADADRTGAPHAPGPIAPSAPGAPVAPGSAPPEFHGLKLSLFQLQAIEAVRADRNVLVSAPTGAGKTLIAEYAIEDAVQRGRRAIYTAPIKALSNQKYRDFRDGRGLDVGLMTGDVTIQPGAQVLVMTTEILRNAILENPDQLADVEYVVLDEVHYMDDVERGSVWEESLIFAPAGIRFISLSATIANLDQFGAWMRSIRPHDLAVVRSDRRPVPLKHRLYHGRVGLFDLRKADWARGKVLGSERDRQREPRRQRRGRDGRDGRRGPELDTRADTSAVLD